MSYDLFLYKRKDSKITSQDVINYLNQKLPFNISESPEQWYYSNEQTGVYFLIDYEEIDEADNFREFSPLNFTCFINYLRPQYFGLEIFPIIDNLIYDLDIYILNPQEETEINEPQKFEQDYLMNQWMLQNVQTSLTNFENYGLSYFPLDKSNYIWEYMFQREQIQNSLEEDIFVCGYFFLKNKSNHKIYTVAIWTQHIPIIIPPVDYILIQKKHNTLSETIEESGLVSYEEVIDELGTYFQPYKHKIPNLMFINQADSDKLSKQFNTMKFQYKVEDFGEGIAKDGFVNIKPA